MQTVIDLTLPQVNSALLDLDSRLLSLETELKDAEENIPDNFNDLVTFVGQLDNKVDENISDISTLTGQIDDPTSNDSALYDIVKTKADTSEVSKIKFDYLRAVKYFEWYPVIGDDGLWKTYDVDESPWVRTSTNESDWQELFADTGAVAMTPTTNRVTEVGPDGVYEAELPNITGRTLASCTIGTDSGVFYGSNYNSSGYTWTPNSKYRLKYNNIDASRASTIYKDGGQNIPISYERRIFKYIG